MAYASDSPSPVTVDATIRIAELRQLVREGKTLSLPEVREAISLLRQGRVAAAKTSATSRATKAAKAPIDSDDLLAGL